MVATDSYAPPLRLPTWPLLALAAAVAVVFLAAAARDVAPPVDVEVVPTAHAEKHPEATEIRRCLRQRGADQVWRSRSWREPFKFFRTCGLDDGTIGLQIVRWSWRALAWREVTSFVVKDGQAGQVFEYLTAIATRVTP